MEFWQTIRGFEDYDVSTLGRVRSYKRSDEPKILKGNIDSKGYLRVHITRFDSPETVMMPVHRLVCNTFIREMKDGEVTDHVNRVTSDNRLSNLRIATYKQNRANAIGNTKKKLPKGVSLSSNGRYRARIKINRQLQHLGTYDTIEEATLAYNKAHEQTAAQYACINEIETELTYADLNYVPHKKSNLPKGVRKIRDRYFARITVNRKEIALGGYETIAEASNAYKAAKIKFNKVTT